VSRVKGYGLSADPKAGWEVEIYQREAATVAAGRAARAQPGALGDEAEPGVLLDADGARVQAGVPTPILHLANFPLPAERGDYGGGAVELMGRGGVFISLLEHDPAEAASALFSRKQVPWPLGVGDFAPNQMQRTIGGQSGCQRFFVVGGRAFCLYVAIGSHTLRALVLPEVNQLLSTIEIS